MTDKLGNDVIRLQKEIMSISNKINLVRTKTHKSMSSILKGLKSLSKDNKSSNNNKTKNKKRIDEKTYFLLNYDEQCKLNNDIFKNNNTIHKKKIYKNVFKKNNGILLNECETNYNKKDIYSKNDLFLNNLSNKKTNNKHIKYVINNYRNSEYNDNTYIDENCSFNDNKKYSERKKGISKTDSLKYIYNQNNNSINRDKNIFNDNNYFQNIDNNINYYYKSDLNHKDYINRLMNVNIYNNKKSRNKNENDFKNKEIETQKNNELFLEYKEKNFINDKTSKTFFSEYFQKFNKINSNKINNSFYQVKNNILHKTYSNINHKNNKNLFRENGSTRIKQKEHNTKKIFDFDGDKNNNINYYYKLLNVKNHDEYIHKINKLLSYEDFIHKIKKLYFKFNDQNKNFKLKDILFWISFNINNDNKKNKYEEYCHEIMKHFNIPNYDKFKIFINNLISKNKNNDYFVNGMKELFNSFNEFQPNKTIYKNRSKNNNTQKFIYKNEDDINNL